MTIVRCCYGKLVRKSGVPIGRNSFSPNKKKRVTRHETTACKNSTLNVGTALHHFAASLFCAAPTETGFWTTKNRQIGERKRLTSFKKQLAWIAPLLSYQSPHTRTVVICKIIEKKKIKIVKTPRSLITSSLKMAANAEVGRRITSGTTTTLLFTLIQKPFQKRLNTFPPKKKKIIQTGKSLNQEIANAADRPTGTVKVYARNEKIFWNADLEGREGRGKCTAIGRRSPCTRWRNAIASFRARTRWRN